MPASKGHIFLTLVLALCVSLAECRATIPSPEVIEDLPSLNASRLVSRLAKPPDRYTPHPPPLRWLAMGDSYTAGPGAGERYDEELPARNCYRNKGSWPVKTDDDFPINVDHKFFFEACSGDKTQEVIIHQLDRVPQDVDLVVLTLGGNDAFFSQVIMTCVLGIVGPGADWYRSCQAVLEKAETELKSDGFRDRLFQVYEGIFSKMPADFHYQVVQVRYPWLFSDQQEDNWCDDKSFLDGYIWPFTKPKLNYELRQDLNRLAGQLNWNIRWAMEHYRKSKQPVGRPHAPGWARNRLFEVDPNMQFGGAGDWTGHRFCEPGARSLRDESIWIIPWSGEDATMSASDLKVDKNTCTQDARYGMDNEFTYSCNMVIALAQPGAPPDLKVVPPESFAKVFHPRTNGHQGLKAAVSRAIELLRPPESQHACVGPLPDIPVNGTIPLESDGTLCTITGDGGQGPDPGNGNGGTGKKGQQIALASYIHPGGGAAEWTRMIGYDNDKVSVLVANVLNGPDYIVNDKWMGVLQQAKAKNKTVIGYVRTGYLGLPTSDNPIFEPFETRLGSRDVSDWVAQIERDVDMWYTLYPGLIDGIFFDEGWNECGPNNKWSEVYRLINDNTKRKHRDAYTVLNPGTGVGECYQNSADTLMTFESSYENYISGNYTKIDWQPRDDRKIWHIIYRVPEDKAVEVAALAAKNHAGLIHITPADMPNPYNTLPSESYMQKLIGAVSGGDPIVEKSLPFPKDGRPAGVPSSSITGSDYTSVSMEWSYPDSDPYGFGVYSGEEELVRLPGFSRHVSIGSFPDGTGSMSLSVKAIGTNGVEGSSSSSASGGPNFLKGKPVTEVKITPGDSHTIVEANVLLPYGFIRIYFTDADRYKNFPAWPISYGPGAVTTHYMVEGSTLFAYDGKNETDRDGNREWKWKEVGKRNNVKIDRTKTSYKWTIPIGSSTEGVDSRYIIIQTEGYNERVEVFNPCPGDSNEKKGTDHSYCFGQPPYDCQGEKLCGHTLDMIKHCDIAANRLVHQTGVTKMYTAGQPMGESGMCSVNSVTGQGCKVYLQGKDENNKPCSYSGDDMWQAYQDIMNLSGCKKCGTKHFGNGCMVSRDYHFDPWGGGCSDGTQAATRFLDLWMNYTQPANSTELELTNSTLPLNVTGPR